MRQQRLKFKSLPPEHPTSTLRSAPSRTAISETQTMTRPTPPHPLPLIALLALCMPCAATEVQTVYRCTDAKGKTTFSDSPCNKIGVQGKESTLEIPLAPAAPPPTKATPTTRPAAATLPAAPAAGRLPLYNGGKPPVIRFFYDTEDAHPDIPPEDVEQAIKLAASQWMRGCPVVIEYGGRKSLRAIKPEQGLIVRWDKSYLDMSHPATVGGSALPATGGMLDGIRMRPGGRYNQNWFKHMILHEMGHTLGMPHNHLDKSSVMSYWQGGMNPSAASPTPEDYRECKFAMQTWYGVDFKPTEAELRAHNRKQPTDKAVTEEKMVTPVESSGSRQ